eukprot:12419103-Karenia_brevis.AAC.1
MERGLIFRTAGRLGVATNNMAEAAGMARALREGVHLLRHVARALSERVAKRLVWKILRETTWPQVAKTCARKKPWLAECLL